MSHQITLFTTNVAGISLCIPCLTFPKTPMAFEPRLRVLVRDKSTSFLLPVSVRTTLWVKGELSVPMIRRAFGPWIKICSDGDGEARS